MALPQIISRNLAQVIGVNVVSSGTTIIIGTTVVTLYTVPTGKQALITSLLSRVTGMGSNTAISITVDAVSIKRVTAAETVATESSPGGGILMNAGEVIIYLGNNAADDGAGTFFISIKEFDA